MRYATTAEQNQDIVRLYQAGHTGSELAKMFGFKTSKSIYDRLKKAGIKLRSSKETKQLQKTYNPSFMNVVDREWKGYFLGLMLTDGWVSSSSNAVALDLVDEDAIQYLSIMIGKDYKTYKHEGGANSHRIVMCDKVLFESMNHLGVCEHKTYNFQKPNLSLEEMIYLKDIVRGIIDGDGTFAYVGENSIYLRITSKTEDTIRWYEWALKVLGLTNLRVKEYTAQDNSLQWKLETGLAENIQILKDSVYRSDYGMKRKRAKLYKERC